MSNTPAATARLQKPPLALRQIYCSTLFLFDSGCRMDYLAPWALESQKYSRQPPGRELEGGQTVLRVQADVDEAVLILKAGLKFELRSVPRTPTGCRPDIRGRVRSWMTPAGGLEGGSGPRAIRPLPSKASKGTGSISRRQLERWRWSGQPASWLRRARQPKKREPPPALPIPESGT